MGSRRRDDDEKGADDKNASYDETSGGVGTKLSYLVKIYHVILQTMRIWPRMG